MSNNKKEQKDLLKGELKNLKKMVIHILNISSRSRNSDSILTLQIWHHYFPEAFIEHAGDKYVNSRYIHTVLPSNDNIKRVRAIVQNVEKQYPPTLWEVAKQRKWLESSWKEALGYNVGPGETKNLFK